MNLKKLGVWGAVLAGGLLLSGQASAATTTVSRSFAGNDCAGYFGGTGDGGFDACTVFVNHNGDVIELSPVIAKYDGGSGGLSLDETNGTDFPSISGGEFSFSNLTSDDDDYNITGEWDYTRDIEGGDPGVRYWVAKAGSGFELFFNVESTLAASGGVCDEATADIYTYACLNEAEIVTSGDWTTPDNKNLSHITFYDTAEVPLPAAAWLFGSALLGLVGLSRKKS